MGWRDARGIVLHSSFHKRRRNRFAPGLESVVPERSALCASGPAQSAAVNRGPYLCTALGDRADCHTPRIALYRPALAADTKQMEENKKTVAAFYDAALNQKDFDAASRYLGSRYTQHNPGVADGAGGPQGVPRFPEGQVPEQPQRD
jgi:hypothetical protein